MAQRVKLLPAMQKTWVRKIPYRRKWQPIPVLLPGKSHGQRSLVDYCPWYHQESDTTERLYFHVIYIYMSSLMTHFQNVDFPETLGVKLYLFN